MILSNIEDKGTNIQKEQITLYDILFSAYTSAINEAEKQKIKMIIECDETIKIIANPILIEQAVHNLIINAIKYSGYESNVWIKAKIVQFQSKTKIKIEIKDDGKGMASDQLERIFERFYRVNREQSKKLGGTGLGLSIVKHIVLAHSGNIIVKSEPEKGSSFIMTFPIL